MITNGLLLNKVKVSALKKLTWLRISLSGIEFDRADKYYKIKKDRLPDFFGFSFVVHKFTDKEQLKEVNEIAEYFDARYVRIVTNCYTIDDLEWGKHNIPKLIEKYPKMFLQWKDYETPAKCYWKYLKPFVNSDGYVYQCSGNSLFTGYFSEKWRVAHWSNIEKIYEKEIKSFNTSICPYCFFSAQNNIVSDLLIDVKHKEFF